MLAKLDIREYYALEEHDRVYAWREEQSERAGFDEDTAALVAAHTEIDLHQVINLVRHGCPPETAFRVLR